MTIIIGLIAFFGALIASIDSPHAALVKGNINTRKPANPRTFVFHPSTAHDQQCTINSGDYPAAMATELDIEMQQTADIF